jgi:V/A-type H+-transporting ATPase subunit D
MENNLFPTKGNLMIAKSTLALSRQGYDLLDKKRNILMREMMSRIDETKELQDEIDKTFSEAYKSLERLNIVVGIDRVDEISHAIAEEDDIEVNFTSVMGVELPKVSYEKNPAVPQFGFYRTKSSLDNAYIKFSRVKDLTIRLAEVENSVYRLAVNIKKTQKRANALKNVTIPRYEAIVHHIQNVLEEKEREEFTRLKVIKRNKS